MACQAGRAGVLLLGEKKELEWLRRALEEEGYEAVLHAPEWTGGWQVALQRAREAYCRLASGEEGAFLLGQSGGAAMALLLAQRHLAKGLVCLSAPMRLRLSAYLSGFGRRDMLRISRLARENLYCVECPVLAVQSAGDPYLARSSAARLLAACHAREKRLLRLCDSSHAVSNGPERALLLSAILAFLRDNREQTGNKYRFTRKTPCEVGEIRV